MLKAHNKVRAEVGLSDFKCSSKLSLDALSWANELKNNTAAIWFIAYKKNRVKT
jgi:hypothetical protein